MSLLTRGALCSYLLSRLGLTKRGNHDYVRQHHRTGRGAPVNPLTASLPAALAVLAAVVLIEARKARLVSPRRPWLPLGAAPAMVMWVVALTTSPAYTAVATIVMGSAAFAGCWAARQVPAGQRPR